MKSINNQAPVTCRKTILINASPEKVWNVLTGINHWTNWQNDISQSKINGTLNPGTTFDWKTGGSRIHSTLHTVTPCHQFGWTGKAFGALAIHNWTLTGQNGKTTVLVEESMEGLLVSLFKKSLRKTLESGMQKWLNLLKETCEK